MLSLLFALGLVGVLSTFVGMATYLIAVAGLYVYAVVDPPFLAKHLETFVPKWYNRWYGYAGWIGILLGLSILLAEVREPLLGYSTFRVPSAAMAPTIEPRDIILVDTRAFRAENPAVGDVVVVHGTQTGRSFIRRVSGRTGSSFSFTGDNASALGMVAELEGVSSSSFLGRVTYVLYSPNTARIGLRVE